MRKGLILKGFLISLLSVLLIFSLVGCQNNLEVSINKTETENPPAEEETALTEAATEAVTEKASDDSEAENEVDEGFMPGKKAYDFELEGLDGTVIKLSDYLGKTVVLNFFASWCPPCQVEMPHINTVYKELKDKDVVIIGINLTEQDNMDDLKALLEEHQIEFPIALDKASEVASLYGIRSIPVNVVLNSEGIVTEYSIGAIDEARLKGFIETAQNK